VDRSRDLLIASSLGVARDGRTLLSGVDLTLRRGEVTAILGPNGVGKSSLLQTLAGLLPLADGAMTSAGTVVAALQPAAMARRSVRANVELALRWWGVPKPGRRPRAEAALDALGITHLAGRRATELSGGEARRVHLARATAVPADVLLLDEPFAGLDPRTRAELLQDATAVLRDPSRAVLIVVHDRAEAWALADHLVVLLDGGVAAAGAPRDLLDAPPSLEVARFLGFSGELAEHGGGRRLVRPGHVRIDPDGDRAGRVTVRVPEEDGVLLDVALDAGAVHVRAPHPGPEVGDRVRLSVEGGVVFGAAPTGPSPADGLAREGPDSAGA
jgi:ABC-type nitrate/sulfonate/bicarbonate transport system ATPase subunit